MSGAQPMRSPRRSASRASAAASADVGRQRLLGVDVLADGERLRRDRGVHERRRQVEDDVDRADRRSARRRSRPRGRWPCRAPCACAWSRSAQATISNESNALAFSTYARLMTPQPDDSDSHATSPSIVMTAASERRASSSSVPTGSSCSTISHSTPSRAAAGDDALEADRAVADRAERVLAAHAEVLDVQQRPASEQRDRDRRRRTRPSRRRARGRLLAGSRSRNPCSTSASWLWYPSSRPRAAQPRPRRRRCAPSVAVVELRAGRPS